jgi:hypothetical protein
LPVSDFEDPTGGGSARAQLVFLEGASHIRPELAKYIPPDTIGHGNAEAVDYISCAVSAGWLPSPRNERCAQRASKSRVSEMLLPSVVSRHKGTGFWKRTVAIRLSALFPLFGRVAPLRNASRGGGVNNR